MNTTTNDIFDNFGDAYTESQMIAAAEFKYHFIVDAGFLKKGSDAPTFPLKLSTIRIAGAKWTRRRWIELDNMFTSAGVGITSTLLQDGPSEERPSFTVTGPHYKVISYVRAIARYHAESQLFVSVTYENSDGSCELIMSV